MRILIKKLISFILVFAMVLEMIPAEWAGSKVVYAEDTTVITRVQWVHDLTELFGMTVEEDNYPDNYFSDISEESEYYRDVMVAVEFGIVDIEAGQAFMPEEPVTRDFAASTMNHCLGYQFEEEITYTYSDYTESAYPEAAQLAIDRGWFALVDGKFNPNQSITTAEKDIMFNDATEIMASTSVDYEYDNKYSFADNVIVIPENTVVTKNEDNTITILNSPSEIKVGSRFVVFFNGLPEIYDAKKVTEENNILTIEVEAVSGTEDIESADAQGMAEGTLSEAEAIDGAEIDYIHGGTAARSYEDGLAFKSQRLASSIPLSAIKASKKIKLGNGMDATFTVTISNLAVDYKINSSKQEVYVAADGTATATCNVSVDMLQAAGIPGSITLVRIPVGGVGAITVSVDYTLQGQVTFSYVADFTAGVQYTKADGFRLVKSFEKRSFTIASEVTMSAGVTAALGIDTLPVISGRIYVKAGAKSKLSSMSYMDGKTPNNCTHLSSYLYASAGASCSVNLIVTKKSFSKSIDFYTEKNSPVRVAYHYEDGKLVPYCTRNKNGYYYSYWGTRYGSDGMRNGISGSGILEVPIWIYDVIEDEETGEKYAKITGYNGKSASLIIPETLDGYEVKIVGESVFKGNNNIYTIVMADTITSIESHAFEKCTNLSNIVLSDNLNSIGWGAFSNCTSLVEVNFPDNFSKIGNGAFQDCTSLKSINIPKDLTTGDYVAANSAYPAPFQNCYSLTNVTFNEGITFIAEGLFYKSGIKSITIPDTVTIINSKAFGSCTQLEEVVWSNNLQYIYADAFAGCTALKEAILPKSMLEIGCGAFSECTSLERVFIPKGMGTAAYMDYTGVFMGEFTYKGSFNRCTGLKEIIFEEGISKIPSGLFKLCNGLERLVIPDSVTEIGSAAFYYCTGLKEIEFGSGLTTLNENAFAQCVELEEALLPESLTSMSGGAFANCVSLAKVYIPSRLGTNNMSGTYGTGAFSECEKLKEVIFGKGIKEIPDGLFRNCTGIEEIVIPDGVTYIGSRTFMYASKLKKIKIPDTVTEISSYAFSSTALEEVDLPDSVIEMWGGIFLNCSLLKKCKLPVNYEVIEGSMFENCVSLEEYEIPHNIIEIEDAAFKNCTGLKNIKWNDVIEEIGNYVFENCDAIEKIEIPDSVESIGSAAFYDCDLLKEVKIADSVTYVGSSMFYDCDELTDVDLGTGISEIPSSCFDHCDLLEKIYLPYSVMKINYNSFNECVNLKEVTIPYATNEINNNAFSYPEKITIYGIEGSYAETFAKDNSIKFVNKVVSPTEIEISDKELTILAGKEARLYLNITPKDFLDVVDWKSSDEDILSVNGIGKIKTNKVGTATVKVNVGDLSESCKVTVVQPVTYVELSKETLKIDALSNCKLFARAMPIDAYNKELKWSSSDESIATVDQNGVVTTYKKGEAVIRVESLDGSDEYAECEVIVENTGHLVETIDKFESSHPYTNNCSDFWQYSLANASNLEITFDDKTEMEDGFDYLHIFDGNGNLIGKYTGTALAGKKIQIPGNTAKIKMVSDKGGTAYGFKIIDVKAIDNITENPAITESPDTIGKNKVEMRYERLDEDRYKIKIWVEEADLSDFEYKIFYDEAEVESGEMYSDFRYDQLDYGFYNNNPSYTYFYFSGYSEGTIVRQCYMGEVILKVKNDTMDLIMIDDMTGDYVTSLTIDKNNDLIPTSTPVPTDTPMPTETPLPTATPNAPVINDEYTYMVMDANEIKIVSYNGVDVDVDVPSEIDGYLVTEIGAYAFYGNESLVNINIPKTVKCVGDRAFENCNKLSEVKIPDSVTSLGVAVFEGCESVLILCSADSSAEIYAKENNLQYLSSKTEPTWELGDVDSNGNINAQDALAILKHAAKISVLTDEQLLAADTSKDGNINASDALLVLKLAAKIIDSF